MILYRGTTERFILASGFFSNLGEIAPSLDFVPNLQAISASQKA